VTCLARDEGKRLAKAAITLSLQGDYEGVRVLAAASTDAPAVVAYALMVASGVCADLLSKDAAVAGLTPQEVAASYSADLLAAA